VNGVGTQKEAIGVCATCGRSITHPGPDGECVHCLVSFGFLADERDSQRRGAPDRVVPAPLRYAHFEVEVNDDGFPVVLGAGAMAVTYRARDSVLNSTVALKVISGKLAENPTARARFLRGARAAAQIQHPNVARVIHYGEQDGECFYAMELVHGETLEARVQRAGPLPLSLALEVVEQAVRGLVAGEACSVIHRDLKPSNLMIESDRSGQLLVKIIDYGVAKVMAPDATPQTQAGFIGTPAFASPEQFDEAGQQQIDTRSDIYALGVTFWYLLTGRTPFAGRSIEEIRTRQTRQLPLEQLKSVHAPLQVVSLLKSMLAVDPARRPQTALELLTGVHRCYVRFEPAARRRQKRLIFAAGALGLTVVLVSLATFVYRSAQSSSEMNRSIAVLPFEDLSANTEDQFFTVGIHDEILTKLASLADLKVIAQTSTAGYKSKPADLKTVAQQLGVGRVLEGSVQRAADKVRVIVQLIDPRTKTELWAKTYDQPFDDVFAVESEVANAVAAQLNAKLAQKISNKQPTQNAAAYKAYLRGLGIEHGQATDSSSKEAAAAYAEAVLLDPDFALAWARLALLRSFFYTNGIDRNANSAMTVKETADRAMELRPDLGEAWLAQGQYRIAVLRDRRGALQAYQEAEKYLPNSGLVNEYMCSVEVRLGHWREAEVHLLRATELDPRNVRLWAKNAQQVFQPLRRWADAQAAIDRALEIAPNDEEAITVKADNFQSEGRLDEAAELLARLPKDSTDPYVLNLRAWQAMCERKFDAAVFWTEQATKTFKPGQPLSFLNIWVLVHQGYFQEWAGRLDEARATFERVIHEIAPSPGSVIAPGRETRSMLALAYAGLGDKQNALEQARQAVADFDGDAYLKPITERYLAQVQARCGDVAAAIAALPHLLEVPNGSDPSSLRFSPFWDPLRKDARFQALLKNPPSVRY
jgi:serine/threonine protein kinase/tetratricopeptide (TPR) repeat protein